MGIITPRSSARFRSGSGSASVPVGRHSVGKRSALPGLVVYVCPVRD